MGGVDITTNSSNKKFKSVVLQLLPNYYEGFISCFVFVNSSIYNKLLENTT